MVNPYAPPAAENAPPPPPTDRQKLEIEVQELAQTAMTYAAVGVLCFGIVLGPVAIMRANKALALIDSHGIGTQYRMKATYARIIGVGDVVLFAAVLFMRLRHF